MTVENILGKTYKWKEFPNINAFDLSLSKDKRNIVKKSEKGHSVCSIKEALYNIKKGYWVEQIENENNEN